MSNGQRKIVRSAQKKKNKTMGGRGAFTAPYAMRRNAMIGMHVYPSIIDRPTNNAVYARARRIAYSLPLTRKQVDRIHKHITTHKTDHTRTWMQQDGDTETLTAGQVAWLLNGGDAAAEWLETLGYTISE